MNSETMLVAAMITTDRPDASSTQGPLRHLQGEQHVHVGKVHSRVEDRTDLGHDRSAVLGCTTTQPCLGVLLQLPDRKVLTPHLPRPNHREAGDGIMAHSTESSGPALCRFSQTAAELDPR